MEEFALARAEFGSPAEHHALGKGRGRTIPHCLSPEQIAVTKHPRRRWRGLSEYLKINIFNAMSLTDVTSKANMVHFLLIGR